MVPFAVAMHYRMIIWDTHRDRVVYLDPLNPIAGEAEQSWIGLSGNLCAKVRNSWSSHELPPTSYGFEVQGLPEKAAVYMLYVVVYMLMFAHNWMNGNFHQKAPVLSELSWHGIWLTRSVCSASSRRYNCAVVATNF